MFSLQAKNQIKRISSSLVKEESESQLSKKENVYIERV
jgi:hypothetical protein